MFQNLVCLVNEPSFGFRIAYEFGTEELEDDWAVKPEVPGSIDNTNAAPKVLEDLVPLSGPAFLGPAPGRGPRRREIPRTSLGASFMVDLRRDGVSVRGWKWYRGHQ